jgi:hypothetical protein
MALPKTGTLKYKQTNGEWKHFATIFQGQWGEIINFDKNFTSEDFANIPVSDYGYRTVTVHKLNDSPTSPFATPSGPKTLENSKPYVTNPDEDF